MEWVSLGPVLEGTGEIVTYNREVMEVRAPGGNNDRWISIKEIHVEEEKKLLFGNHLEGNPLQSLIYKMRKDSGTNKLFPLEKWNLQWRGFENDIFVHSLHLKGMENSGDFGGSER